MSKRSKKATRGVQPGDSAAPHLIALEQRMMFDGAAVETGLDTAQQSLMTQQLAAVELVRSDAQIAVAEQNLARAFAREDLAREDLARSPSQFGGDQSYGRASWIAFWRGAVADQAQADQIEVGASQATAPANVVVFIDTNVVGYDQLVSEWQNVGTVVLIDGTRDGIDQMRTALLGQSNLSAIHIVSHGTENAFQLGTTVVTRDGVLGELAGSFAAIGRTLAVDGDILIYGCDVSADAAGQNFIDAIAAATGADVAASVDDTGAAALGGDWDLESRTGAVSASVLVSDSYAGLLQLTNSGTWTIAGQGGSQNIGGVTTTITLTNGTGTWSGTGNDTFNPALPATTFVPGVSGSASLITVFNAPTAGQTGTITITFSEAVTNPIINLDRLGGINTAGQSNSATLTIATPGATLTRLSGVGHFVVTGTTITRTSGVASAGAESSTNTATGTAAGSVQVNGTFTSLTFNVSAPAGDGFEIGVSVNRNPPVVALTGTNLLTNGGFESGATGWTSNVGIEVASNEGIYGIPANPEGVNFVEIEGTAAVTPASTPIYIETTVPTVAGQTYTVNLQAVTRSGGIGDRLSVLVNGTAIDTFTTTNAWETYGVTFTATGATTTLRLASAGSLGGSSPAPGDGSGLLVDDVRVVATNNTASFTENGAPVPIATANNLAFDGNGSTLRSATITLTNAQAGDQLLVNGSAATSGTLTGGISYTITGNIVTLTGASSEANYAAAIRAIQFNNTTDRPSTVQRVITVQVNDGAQTSNVARAFINVTEVNDPPTAVIDPLQTIAEDTPRTISVLANDTDRDGDPLTVTTATATNGTVVINGDGTITYTPNANFNGTDTITYTISDGRGGTSTATVPITITPVNDAPTAVGTLPPQANLDGTSGISLATASAFADVDGPSATYSATGLPAGLSINSATGEITGTIDRSASQTGGGVYNVVVTRSDGSLSATQPFRWTITNPPPVAVNDTTLTVNEDTAGTTVNALTNDSDPDGDPLTITGATATNGTVVVNANGTLTFTPNANYNGTATITYTISDGQGGTATATVPVNVIAVNDAPVPVGSLPPQTNVDAAAGINVATAGAFSDVDNATLTYSATGLPAGLSIDAATGVITGTIDRSASQGGVGGVYSVVVTARDAGGLTATQTFSWTVTNPAPTATNDTATTPEDTVLPAINVLGNDSDPDGDPLTVTSASAVNGTVTINPDGTLRYAPNTNFNGNDTITYTISDGQGGTSTATVTVTVAAVNDAPVPVGSLPPQTNFDAQAVVSVPTAQGFTDVDGNIANYFATGLPAGLTMNAATGVISGTIAANASQTNGGVYNVRVFARDSASAVALQTFTWTITNPPPVAVNDTATTTEDTPVTVNVLANDSDPDADALTIVSAVASIGTASVVGNQVQYTPPANFNGTATITYTISDGQGGTSTATLTVTVTPVNDAPVATPIAPRNTTDGSAVSVPVAGNFTDVDGDPLTFTGTGLPPGLTIDPVTGVISGTVDKSASQTGGGVYTATITASDGKGGTVTQTITFNVSNPPPVATNDTASTPEDTPVTISPLANDSDPDGDPLTITSASALNGTVVINPDGTVTYTPNPGYNGTDTITYEISDGNGGTSTATITVSVADVNDVPVTSGSIGDQTNLDAQVISLPVAGAFVDPDGDTLSFTAAGLPAGLTIDAATGIISGTIDNSASQVNGGAYTITVTASDGRGGTVSQTFSWTVTNPAPGAVNDTATTSEDTPVRVPVLANDADPDGDTLTVTAASAGKGTVTINPDGSLLYTPNANFNGTDTILYTITDSEGGVSTASVTVTVTPVNDAPTTVGLPNQNGDDGAAVSVPTASAFTDVDGDVLTFGATGLPPGLSIDPATGLISGTLPADASENGPYIVTVTATDPSGASVTTSFVFGVQNIPPVATNDTANTPEDTPVTVAVLTNDSDPDGDPLTITSASANNGTVVVNANGTLTFTPAPNFNGVATVSYTVSDGEGGIATATLTINVGPVNDAPTSLPIPDQASVDGAFYSAGVAPFFSDLDGDTLTFSATGLPAGLTIDSATGVVSGTIDPNASQVNGGVYTVTITADDGNGGTVSRTLTATVTNPAPTANNDSATTAEDTPIPAINVLGNDTDPDGDPLTVTSATALNGTVTINPDGTLNYVPNPNFNGTDTITYVISDGDGGTSTAAVTITVTPVNDPPVAVNDTATTNEDTPVTIGVLGNDTDVDGDPLTVTAATSPNGTVVINPDGTLTFTPAQNFNGPATITYTISDGNGGTSTATVNVTVDPVNDAPVANPSSVNIAEDTPVTIPVLANDTDVDGDPLTVTAASAPNGTVTINPDGTVRYVPNPNFNGTDTITYTITDGKGGFSTSTVTVSIAAANDAPVPVGSLPAQTNFDAQAVVSVPTAQGFNDVDGNIQNYFATGLPPGLTMNAATGVISGTIAANASQTNGGVYNVRVFARDIASALAQQTFTWTISNPAPIAANDTAATNEDTAVAIPVLANDSDPDGDALTVTSATAPNGTVTIGAGGVLTYTPNANFNGTDTITYTISDGQGGTSTAIVTVTVNPSNDAPVVDTPIAAQTGVDNAPVTIPVAGNFSDLDGDTLSFTASGLPTGLSIDPATGIISGTIDRNASQGGPNADGIYTVSVTASDGKGGTVTTTFTYTVTNPAPVAVNDTATTPEDTPVTISPLANDNDPDGDPLTITSATSPDGAVVINPDGTITFTPAANFNGATTITYAISDGNGGTATATVNVTVTPVNDAPTVDTPLADASGVDGTAESIPTAGAFSDLDGDTLSFSATGLPLGLSIDPATGLISGTVDRSASQVNGGVYTIAVTANDGNGGTVTSTFTYTVTNPGPTAVNDVANTPEDTPVIISPLANDTDPDADPLTITAASAINGTVVINPDGTVTYTPNANFNGTDTITYTISDGQGGTSTATIEVTVAPVNDAPTADPPLSPQTNVDADIVSVDVSPSFADLDGDTLTYSAAGLPAGLSISAAGVITGTVDPAASQTNGGVYNVTVTANDGNGGTVTSTFTWTVTNPAPNAVNDNAVTDEDTPVNIPVLANDIDPDGDALTVTAASAPNGTVTIGAGGVLTYTPAANFNGTDTITYTISDGQGGTSTATVTVVVNAVNDAPATLGLPNQFDIDNSIVSIPLGPNFTDVDGDTLTFSASGLPAGVTINPATGLLSGQIANNASTINGGVYTVTVSADDGKGGITTTNFIWTISNTAPDARDDVASTNEDAPVTFNVLSDDVDPDSDPLTVVSATASIGTVVVNPDGTLTYTPPGDFNGTATVTYQITDGNGGFSTATAVITVNPVNDAPDATPLPNRADQDGDVISIPAGDQFTDRDGDTLQFSATGLPAGLSIDQTTGVISGTIAADASTVNGGVYTVTVTADDGNGGLTPITFTYTVTNPGPTAVDDTAATAEDTPTNIGVLANDTDPDNDALTVTAASAPNGTVVINPDGTLTYTPDVNFNGTDTITYTISDGQGGTSTAIVTVTVVPRNDAPTATPLPARANVDGAPVTLDLSGNFSDLDGDTLAFTATGLPTGLSMDASGNITGTIAPGASQDALGGIFTVTVTADDGNGGTVSQTFSWTVTNPPPVAVNDTASTPEDTAVDIPVLANDSDPDGDALTVTTASAGNGTVTIGAGGVLTYTPNQDFNGTDTITYTISDGNGGTSTATVTVTVDPVNDAPVSTPLAPRSNADSAVVSVPVAANFSDVDNATLAFSATGLPAGLSIDPATGVISGTIDRAASQVNGGVYSVTVTATDAGGLTTSQTFTWTVTNPPPVAANDTATTAEDTLVNIPVLTNDSDPDGDPLTISTASAANGTVVIKPDGTIDYTPNGDFNGTDTITYTISDGNGGTATATVTVTVTPVNDAPVANDDTSTTDEDTPVTIAILPNDSDVDGDPLTVTAASSPNGTVVINPDGTVTYTPNPNFNGTDTITYTISDGKGGTDTATVTVIVRPENDPPVATNDTATTPEDTPVIINVLGNDTDVDGDPLTVVAGSSPDGQVTINPDGSITFTPDPNFNGTTTVTYTISDGKGGFATATVALTVGPVNDPPVAVNDNAQTLEDTPVTVAVLTNDSDVDGDPLTVTAASAGNGTVVINPDGTITYTPNRDFNGVDLVTYTISDGKGGTSTATVTIGVGLDNDAPVGTPIAAQTNSDSDVVSLPLAGNFSDVDGDPLTFSATGLPAGLSIDPTTGLISGTIDREASQPNGGVYNVSVTVADGQGGATTQTFSWTVTNPAPVAANDTATTPEDTPVTLSPLVNDTDPDGDPLAISTASAPNGTVVINPDGTITYTPDPNFNGTDTITYTINDGNGGTSTATITVTVAPVNDSPVAINDNASTAEDTPVTVAVLPNDSDLDGDPLTVVGAIAANGTVVINPDGTITYTPNPDFNGVDTITYTISDGQGGTSTATVTMGVGLVNDAPTSTPIAAQTNPDSAVVSLPLAANFTDLDGDPLEFSAVGLPAGLSINPVTGLISGTIDPSASQPNGGVYSVTITAADGNGGATSQTFTWTVTNPAPNATNDTATTSEDAAVTIAVLANDNDPDRDPLTVTAATSPNGTVVINADGTLTFTPTANFNGPATITYTISDGNGGTATAIATVNVTPVNDAPIARSDSAVTNEDTPATIPVLPNDSDVDGDPLTVTAASAANGTVTINPDGTLRYTPNPNFNGTDTITYTISDGKGGTATTTVAVTVNPVNDVPVAAIETATTPEDAPVTIPVLANDSDVDGDPLTVTSATSPNGTVVINPDGTITFTPNPNFNGPAVITYTVSDGKGGTATATATVNVTPVNDPPVARPDTVVTNEDTPVRVPVLANDSDVDGNPLTVVAASAPNGTVTINPDGTVTYTPNPNFNGTDTITYQISDGQGGFATSTITVTVAPVNDVPIAANDVIGTDENVPVRIPVLANDFDADGDPLTVTAATSPNGIVTINPDGTITFAPADNFSGPATISYTVSDGKGGTATATVTVNVRNVNEPPVDGDEAVFAIGGSPVTIPVLDNASDPDGSPLSIFSAKADVGTVIINPDGTITYTAPADFQGVATITYIVSDGRGGFVESVAVITVTQANADVNALLGAPRDPGIPDGWRVDEVRDQTEEFVDVPLIIDQTANEFRSLNPTPMLFVDRPLLTAVNGLSSLRGITDLTDSNGPVGDVVDDLDRVRDIRFGADRLFDPRFGDFIVKSLTGFSVRQLNTGVDQVMVESVVRDQVVYMEMRDIGTENEPRIVEYQLRTRSGEPLPDWIRMDKRGLAIIERPADADTIRLIIRAIREDGKVFEIPVLVQGATGEIQIDEKLVGKKVSAAEPLAQTMAMATNQVADEAARLAAAFGSKA